MAANNKTSLPEDVEIDGEFAVRRDIGLFAKQEGLIQSNAKSRFLKESSSLGLGLKEKHLASVEFESRHESGYGSLLSQSSLKSTGSYPDSLGSKSQSSDDKTPVQCSDDKSDNLSDISARLSDLSVVDEGIDSLKSVESVDDEHAKDRRVTETVPVPSDLDTEQEDIDLSLVYLDQDGDGDTILHTAIVSELISLSIGMINLCPSVDCLNVPNKLYQTPLHVAVLTNLAQIVRLLVKKGADVLARDQQGNTALHLACRTGNKDIIETIVESTKTNPTRLQKLFTTKNAEGLTCLHVAAEKKHHIVMGYLFANGADVNMGDAKSGRTILHYAVERKDKDTVKILLTHPDIDVDCVTYKGESPLVIAYWRNYQDIVKTLKSKGAYFSFDLVNDWEEDETS